jgi:uncharacterized membrane protein
MLMPKKEVIEMDISVDQALKYVISLGVVPPDKAKPKRVAKK